MRTTLELKHKQSNCDTQLLIKVKDVSKDLISGEINRIANNYVKYASWFSDYNESPVK